MIPIGNENVISVKNLTKSYREAKQKHLVLKGLDLNIADGEAVALLGRSGSGKSTLLNLIGGIDVPDAGCITINGRVVTGLRDHERTIFRRGNIGFIYQFFNLIPTLNVGENLQLVLDLNKTGDAKEQCRAMLNAVGLGDRFESFPDMLSGGEQQRVAIARALIHKPAIILADEPTGNLDGDTADQIWDLFDRLIKGSTMLLATHSITAAKRCDRILELSDGKLHDCTNRYR